MAKLEGFDFEAAQNPCQEILMPYNRDDWTLARTIFFRRCLDTKKLIWPFTKAYRSTRARIKMPSQMTSEVDADTKWLAPSSYTYRKLTETS